MTYRYKTDEFKLEQITNAHISPVAGNKAIKLIVNYKTLGLANLLVRNRIIYNDDSKLSHHTVYKYTAKKILRWLHDLFPGEETLNAHIK